MIQLRGHIFRDAGFGGMNGFFDFLRGESGIVGVRFSPCQATELLAALVESSDKLIMTRSPFADLCFYPRGRQEFDEMRSGDRDMIRKHILKSEDGTYAVTFSLDLLSPEEYRSLCALLGTPQDRERGGQNPTSYNRKVPCKLAPRRRPHARSCHRSRPTNRRR